MKLLFVCTRNRYRSVLAEAITSHLPVVGLLPPALAAAM